MDARLVWDTWRRILTDDHLVDWVVHSGNSGAGKPAGLTAAELAILAEYAATPVPTDTNIGMYRRGLVRNALAALSFVPLTRRLLNMSGLDVDAVAANFMQATGYIDNGPNFWRIAGGFVAYLSRLPEFAAGSRQDVLALDAAAIALALRLGEAPPDRWPEDAAINFCEARPRAHRESLRFVASRAAVVAFSHYDLTPWLENAHDFDADEELKLSTHYWLIYFPAVDAAHTYAELSERTARAFDVLSDPKTAAEALLALDGLSGADMLSVIDSLAQLGVISERDCLHSSVKSTSVHQGIPDLGHGETLRVSSRPTSGAAIT